jgi:hypothetical protein
MLSGLLPCTLTSPALVRGFFCCVGRTVLSRLLGLHADSHSPWASFLGHFVRSSCSNPWALTRTGINHVPFPTSGNFCSSFIFRATATRGRKILIGRAVYAVVLIRLEYYHDEVLILSSLPLISIHISRMGRRDFARSSLPAELWVSGGGRQNGHIPL